MMDSFLATAMRRAILLARRGIPDTAPNPAVGAVLVKNGEIIAEGWHQQFGDPHAEVNCLDDAASKGVDPAGSTMLVTLEPCNHQGKTPPCTQAILNAGIRRVIVGCSDPSLKAGGGAEYLRSRGVQVEYGLFEQECRELITDFLHWQTSDLPYLTLKMASTLDGFIATRTGKSRWITGTAARERVHVLRAKNQAVLIGGGTLRTDNPLLTIRFDPLPFGNKGESSGGEAAAAGERYDASDRCFCGNGGDRNSAGSFFSADNPYCSYLADAWLETGHPKIFQQPLAVVLANSGLERGVDSASLPKLLTERGDALVFITGRGSELAKQRELAEEYGAKVEEFDFQEQNEFNAYSLAEILRFLRRKYSLHRILCEGGGRLALNLLKAGLVQEFELHQAPCLMADKQAVNIFDGLAPKEISDVLSLDLVRLGRLGGDIISGFKLSK